MLIEPSCVNVNWIPWMKPLPSTDNKLPATVIVASVASWISTRPPIIKLITYTISVTFNNPSALASAEQSKSSEASPPAISIRNFVNYVQWIIKSQIPL